MPNFHKIDGKISHKSSRKETARIPSVFSVVGITGPRQSGKSTLLLQKFSDYAYVNFDDIRLTNAFYEDPQKFMRLHADHVIFDEVQKVPELFNYIKIAVDKDRDVPGKFILTGSSQFSFMRKISESLAGRIGLLSLLPYQFSELPSFAHEDAIFRGSYPELVEKKYQLANDWFSSYIDTYINTDVRTLINIGEMRDFMRLMSLLAANTAQQLNFSRYANDIGVDVKTIKRWLSVLEASYIIFFLPPYYENLGKRITKSPKIYFYDTGLVSYLTGISQKEHYEKGPMAGSLFENYVIAEVYKRELHTKSNTNLYYYRTTHGVEVDLIIDHKRYKELIEIKKGETYHPKMIKPMETLLNEGDKAFLLYNGETIKLSPDVDILNYKDYLGTCTN